ncbi:DUF4235 domain-containing protein [Streptomyces malaysiense]|uniref:DUF4235 domain-containing protein n=1 Tax=Streptomyces malaysiense TaxID=1428626 RepID=A0A1J4Q971_9ACTN|nr:DUF4235 domain-containing protein [Streptomyces malaysiense]OIK29521.1 hypothetical protein VT52_000185 [Streptomyces malaysiense]
MSKSKKSKLPFVYQPVGFVLGWASGALAGLAFKQAWKAIRHEDEAPTALDEDRRLREILLAAALQGAIFAVVRSAVDRTGAKAIARSTGVWPVAEGKGNGAGSRDT